MSSSASSSGYNSAAHSVEMEISPSFYSQHHHQNVYAIYSPQLHIYSQHNGAIPPQSSHSNSDFSPRDANSTEWTQPQQMTPEWMAFNAPTMAFGNGNAPTSRPPPYGTQQQYGQS